MNVLKFRGDRLKELREQEGFSQDGFAKELTKRYGEKGISATQGFIGNIESGTKRPSWETLAAIVDFFHVDYTYFLEGLDNEDDPHRVVMYGRNAHEARTIRTLVARMDQLSNEERNQIHAIAAGSDMQSAAECRTIHALINNTMRLTPQERHMILMLTKRLSETQPLNTQTTEADQAADIIDQLPDLERVKALDAVRGVATDLTLQVADKRASVSAILSIVDDVSDLAVRDRLRLQVAASFGVDLDSIK